VYDKVKTRKEGAKIDRQGGMERWKDKGKRREKEGEMIEGKKGVS